MFSTSKRSIDPWAVKKTFRTFLLCTEKRLLLRMNIFICFCWSLLLFMFCIRPVTHYVWVFGFSCFHVFGFLGFRVFSWRKKVQKKLNGNCSFKKNLFYTRKKKTWKHFGFSCFHVFMFFLHSVEQIFFKGTISI